MTGPEDVSDIVGDDGGNDIMSSDEAADQVPLDDPAIDWGE